MLVAADVVLAQASGVIWLLGGVALWGLSLGLSQGLLAALVAGSASEERRGTAFGLFNLVSGIALLVSGLIAGELWDHVGAPIAFYTSASFAALALLGLLQKVRSLPRDSKLPTAA